MISKANKKLVVIKPLEIEETSEAGIIKSEVEKDNLMKKQNRGTISHIGDGCVFCKVGDFVSFYRNAATPLKEDGVDYLVINEDHILVTLKETNE